MAGDGQHRMLIYGGPAILYMAVIFVMSAFPGHKIPSLGFDFGDKILHLIEFGLLGIFLYRAMRFWLLRSHPYLWAIALGTLYAASDEFHQYFVPGRFCEWGDFGADVVGIMLFAGISAWANRKR